MSLTHTRRKMTTIEQLNADISDLKYRIKATEEEKMTILENLKDSKLSVEQTEKKLYELKDNIFSMKKEIGDREIHPEWYKVSAGAGTMEDLDKHIKNTTTALFNLQKDLEIYNELVNEYDDREREATNTIEDLEDQRDDLLHQIADMIGLENLNNERKKIGKEMAKHFRIQRDSYELQKERYESCKRTFGFTPEDREFIAHHTGVKEEHQAIWERLRIRREELCELIDALDPNFVDHGYDEEEDA